MLRETPILNSLLHLSMPKQKRQFWALCYIWACANKTANFEHFATSNMHKQKRPYRALCYILACTNSGILSIDIIWHSLGKTKEVCHRRHTFSWWLECGERVNVQILHTIVTLLKETAPESFILILFFIAVIIIESTGLFAWNMLHRKVSLVLYSWLFHY